MDKKREEISEKTAFPKQQIWEKKITLVLEPFCWLKSTIVWTLINNMNMFWTLLKSMKPPDFWFSHAEMSTNLHSLRKDKKLEQILEKTSA